MRRRVFHPPHPPGRVNVTPMIDVIMVLIVFYLIVGQLAAESKRNMPLPIASSGSRHVASEPLVINVVVQDGLVVIEVDRRAMNADQLAVLIESRLASRPDTTVQIRADRSLMYGAVEPIIAACRAAGVGTVRIATEVGE